MALRPRTPVGLNCSLGSPIQSSGPLGALLSSPALSVRLPTGVTPTKCSNVQDLRRR